MTRLRKSQPIEGASGISHGTGEAVEPCDSDPVRLAGLDGFECSLEVRTRPLRAGLVEILAPADDDVPLRCGQPLDALALHLRADEALALASCDAGNPDVSNQSHTDKGTTVGYQGEHARSTRTPRACDASSARPALPTACSTSGAWVTPC